MYIYIYIRTVSISLYPSLFHRFPGSEPTQEPAEPAEPENRWRTLPFSMRNPAVGETVETEVETEAASCSSCLNKLSMTGMAF